MILGGKKVIFMHNAPVGTRCVIRDPETDDVIAEGVSTVFGSDQFNKSTGRKKSFTKAIAGFTREERGDFWFDYKWKFDI